MDNLKLTRTWSNILIIFIIHIILYNNIHLILFFFSFLRKNIKLELYHLLFNFLERYTNLFVLFYNYLKILPHLLFKCWYKYMKQFLKNILNEFWIIQPNQLKFNPINPKLELGSVPRIRGWARFSYQPTRPTSCRPLFMTLNICSELHSQFSSHPTRQVAAPYLWHTISALELDIANFLSCFMNLGFYIIKDHSS